ncbi:MAG: type II CAAX endopeptidase family protein [Acidobacteriota bacterium]
MFWKVLQFPLVRFLIATSVLLLIQIGSVTLIPVHLRSVAGIFVALCMIVLFCAAYAAYVRIIERRPVEELSLRGAAFEFVRGYGTGMVLFLLTMFILMLGGIATITSGAGWAALGYACIVSLYVGVTEELLIRGVLFRIVEESLGSWLALAISAAIFGGLHAFNPGANLFDSLAIALEAGVLLAAVYMYTRRLWMVIGLHAAWNFTEGGIFGSSVSGGTSHGLLTSTFSGPALFSGGKFGPEASIVAVLVCFSAAVVFLMLAGHRRHIAPPLWRRNRNAASTTEAHAK